MGTLLIDDPVQTDDLLSFERVSSGWATGTAWNQAWATNPTISLNHQAQIAETGANALTPEDVAPGYQMGALERIANNQASPRLTPDQADERYGIPGELTFKNDYPDGVREGTARLLKQWKQEEITRRDILARATPGFVPGAARLGAQFAASALDPINIATAFIPVLGEARFLALAGKVGLPLARVARGALEGAVGQAAIEPLILLQARTEQSDYDAYDSLLNITFGALIGGALHVGGGFVKDRIVGAPDLRPRVEAPAMTAETHHAALSGAVAAVAEDRPVMVADYVRAVSRRDNLMGGTSLGGAVPEPTIRPGGGIAKVDAIVSAATPLPFGRATPEQLSDGTGQHAFFIDGRGHLYTAPNETGGHTAGIQMLAREDGVSLAVVNENGKAIVGPDEISIWDYQARRGLVNVTKYGKSIGIEATEGSLSRSQISAIGRLIKDESDGKPSLLVNDRDGNEVGYFKTLAEFSKHALKKDGKSVGNVLDADFEPEVNTRKTRADAERIKQEQAKREALLADAPGLAAYAKERGISVAEMRQLLSDNYRNAKPVLANLQKQMESAEFKSAEVAAHDRASRLDFKDLSGVSNPLDQPGTMRADAGPQTFDQAWDAIRAQQAATPGRPTDLAALAAADAKTKDYARPATLETESQALAQWAADDTDLVNQQRAAGNLDEADEALLKDGDAIEQTHLNRAKAMEALGQCLIA